MTRVLLSALFAGLPLVEPAGAAPHAGYAAHYRPGLMQRVARNRGLEVVPCMVASPHHRIGTWLRVTSPKRKKTLSCRVTDVPQPKHRPALIQRKIVVELDFESARILCGIRRVGQEPPSACPVIVERSP